MTDKARIRSEGLPLAPQPGGEAYYYHEHLAPQLLEGASAAELGRHFVRQLYAQYDGAYVNAWNVGFYWDGEGALPNQQPPSDAIISGARARLIYEERVVAIDSPLALSLRGVVEGQGRHNRLAQKENHGDYVIVDDCVMRSVERWRSPDMITTYWSPRDEIEFIDAMIFELVTNEDIGAFHMFTDVQVPGEFGAGKSKDLISLAYEALSDHTASRRIFGDGSILARIGFTKRIEAYLQDERRPEIHADVAESCGYYVSDDALARVMDYGLTFATDTQSLAENWAQLALPAKVMASRMNALVFADRRYQIHSKHAEQIIAFLELTQHLDDDSPVQYFQDIWDIVSNIGFRESQEAAEFPELLKAIATVQENSVFIRIFENLHPDGLSLGKFPETLRRLSITQETRVMIMRTWMNHYRFHMNETKMLFDVWVEALAVSPEEFLLALIHTIEGAADLAYAVAQSSNGAEQADAVQVLADIIIKEATPVFKYLSCYPDISDSVLPQVTSLTEKYPELLK